jgi:hypothetical protein
MAHNQTGVRRTPQLEHAAHLMYNNLDQRFLFSTVRHAPVLLCDFTGFRNYLSDLDTNDPLPSTSPLPLSANRSYSTGLKPNPYPPLTVHTRKRQSEPTDCRDDSIQAKLLLFRCDTAN